MRKIPSIFIILLLIIALTACSFINGTGNDPNYGLWVAVNVEMQGQTFDASEAFDSGFTIELKPNSKCVIKIGDVKENGNWKLNDGVFSLQGKDLELFGTLTNARLYLENVLDTGMNVILFKDGIYPEGLKDTQGTMSSTASNDIEKPIPGVLAWWDGEWYGYWEATTAYGDYEEYEDKRFDCYVVIKVNSDMTATMYIWDENIDIATAEIAIDESGGIAEVGSATSEGGEAFGAALKHADWVIMPTYEGYEDYYKNVWYDDYMEFNGYLDIDSRNAMDYRIVLRPWGKVWDDMTADNRPPSYEMWYLHNDLYKLPSVFDALKDSLLNGKLYHIHTAFQEGTSTVENKDPGNDTNSEGGDSSGNDNPDNGDGLLKLSFEELQQKIDEIGRYIANQEGDKLTYAFVVELFGKVEGKFFGDGDDFVRYIWYASDEGGSVVTFTKADGKLMYSHASTSTAWKP